MLLIARTNPLLFNLLQASSTSQATTFITKFCFCEAAETEGGQGLSQLDGGDVHMPSTRKVLRMQAW
jgi:hypothetical protein